MKKNLTEIKKGKEGEASTSSPENKARAALLASVNSAIVIDTYQGNIMGSDPDLLTLVDGLNDTFKEVKSGDLSEMEAMLISQATALQTIFTSLARKAHSQTYQKHYEAFLGLALKAQAQSRATITALVDLRYPRQATFVKQANIAHGAQQVNNGVTDTIVRDNQSLTHAKENQTTQNKLLETNDGQEGVRMDVRAKKKAK